MGVAMLRAHRDRIEPASVLRSSPRKRGPRAFVEEPEIAALDSRSRGNAKLDELLHAHSQANNALTKIDDEEPEDIVRHRTQARAAD